RRSCKSQRTSQENCHRTQICDLAFRHEKPSHPFRFARRDFTSLGDMVRGCISNLKLEISDWKKDKTLTQRAQREAGGHREFSDLSDPRGQRPVSNAWEWNSREAGR